MTEPPRFSDSEREEEPLRFDEPVEGAEPGADPGTVPDEPPRWGGRLAESSRVIVKVTTPGYVPPGFDVRTRIDDRMFTADASRRAVADAADDPQVEAVEAARDLHLP